ncbi:hypothetical protein [Azorhizobium doebereinerae]|uniref:hypothetical protein n=1 Tax=Azorhizobium doebereinerae TaxID=281091 RepID=UPI000425D853|nr:hypothetical protein [Azorhizobium doebereinerae]
MYILLYVCLIGAPGTCKEERINWSAEEALPMACIMRSQAAIAEWAEGHPQWHVGRWKCVPASRLPRDI